MEEAPPRALRLTIVIEWANTRLHGQARALRLLDAIGRQWRQIVAREHPAELPEAAGQFLDGLDPRLDLLLVSAEPFPPALADDLRRRVPAEVDLALRVAEGLEYYPLKNFGASLATGDVLLFVDSDVLPEAGWLAHLLGSFARPEIHAVSGQTYIAPVDLTSRAYALGWTYALRDAGGGLVTPRKFYGNNLAFRADLFRKVPFRPLGLRSRGACSLLREDLAQLGLAVWENRAAGVDHPPPSGLGHMLVRALAHGRDQYLTPTGGRSASGLGRSLGIAAARLAIGFERTRRDWRRVGLRRYQVPAALAIIAGYYGAFALGGLLTHVSPRRMGRRFRV